MSAVIDEDDFAEDSPEAILRCAVAVACCDGEFASDERDKVRAVYADICREMTFAYNNPDESEDFEVIAEATAEHLLSIPQLALKLEYVRDCGSSITDKDLRELTLVMALRLAGADFELAEDEYQALAALAKMWGIRLKDVLQPYSNY